MLSITMKALLNYLIAVQRIIPVTSVPRHPAQDIFTPGLTPQAEVRDALLTSSIIPDVLDDFYPQYSLEIVYPATHTVIELGDRIDPVQVHESPVYNFQPFDSQPPGPNKEARTRYTLALTDPDARSRENPDWSEMCHWIVSNISSPELLRPGKPDRTPDPTVLKSYLPPSPPKGTGWHRYVLVLLGGDEKDSKDVTAPKDRKHWGYGHVRHGVRDWANDQNLEVLGVNFFYSMAANETSLPVWKTEG